jgi:hypothetical protein
LRIFLTEDNLDVMSLSWDAALFSSRLFMHRTFCTS